MAEKSGIVLAAGSGVTSGGVETPRPARVGIGLATERVRTGVASGEEEAATGEGRILDGRKSAIREGSGA